MGGGGGVLTILGLLFLAFVGFMIYFIFKALQFVIQAVDLYKDMVRRLDKIIELLSSRPAYSPSAPVPENIQKPSSDGPVAPSAMPYINFLIGLGYQVIQDGERWSIKEPNSTVGAYAYSLKDLKNQVEDAAKRYNVPFEG